MINPFTIPGWNLNRYMLSAALSGVATTFALSLALTGLAGAQGVLGLSVGAYATLALGVTVQLSRLGASNFKRAGPRGACLRLLDALLWSQALLSVPGLGLAVLDVASAAATGCDRHALAVTAVVFGVLAVAAGLNLGLFLRSTLWGDFRAFSLQGGNSAA